MIWIDVTKKCNLKCSYCDNHCLEYCSKEVIFECLEKYPKEHYSISGGEPFLVDFLDEIVSKVKCTVYTNGTIKRKINAKLIVSLHLDYPRLWPKVIETTKGNDAIYNIICRKFDDYPFDKLEHLLKDIKVLNIQPDCSQKIDFKEIEKFYRKMEDLGVQTQYKFDEVLKYFEPCKCINTSFKLMPDGSLRTECGMKPGLNKCIPNCKLHEFLSRKHL